jgi:hypothetical protein
MPFGGVLVLIFRIGRARGLCARIWPRCFQNRPRSTAGQVVACKGKQDIRRSGKSLDRFPQDLSGEGARLSQGGEAGRRPRLANRVISN